MIKNINLCHKFDVQYNGTVHWGRDKQAMITLDSIEAQIVCESLKIWNKACE